MSILDCRSFPAILIISFVCSLTTYAQSDSDVLKKAGDLVKAKKYESAFKILQAHDPHNTKPDVVLMKEDIVLNYFVTSIMHQMFALKDLEKDEDILDYRGVEGIYGMQTFNVNEILDSLIKIYPNDCRLYKGLGEFYHEVNLKYPENWVKSSEEVHNLAETNFKKAIEGECGDYMSYYVVGYCLIERKQYQEAVPYFLRAIKLNDRYTSSHYNLAYAYLYLDDYENALRYAKKSLDQYTDLSYKGDAARMIGQIYTELKNEIQALKYYELANQIEPENYYNLKPLLNLYVKRGESEKAGKTADTFFNLAPTNPSIYNDLENIYYDHKKEKELLTFYQAQLPPFKDNVKVSANLYFYSARIYLDDDKKLAKEYLLKAKALFTGIYEKDHQVFQIIDELIKESEN